MADVPSRLLHPVAAILKLGTWNGMSLTLAYVFFTSSLGINRFKCCSALNSSHYTYIRFPTTVHNYRYLLLAVSANSYYSLLLLLSLTGKGSSFNFESSGKSFTLLVPRGLRRKRRGLGAAVSANPMAKMSFSGQVFHFIIVCIL